MFRDILYELAHVGELPLPQRSPVPTNKRERNSDSPISTGSIDATSDSGFTDTPRTIAGSRRVSAKDPSSRQRQPLSPPMQRDQYALPIYSDELGRLPLHGQVSFSATQALPTHDYWGTPATGTDLQHNLSDDSHQHLQDDSPGQMSTITSLYPMDAVFYDHLADYSSPFPSTSMAPSTSPQYVNAGGVSMHGYTGEMDPRSQQHQQQQVSQVPNPQAMIDENMIAMWSSAPSGFEFVSSSHF